MQRYWFLKNWHWLRMPFAAFLLATGLSFLFTAPLLAQSVKKERATFVIGCWGKADKGDSFDLKIHFVGNGALVQYDETKVEKLKRSFGAWEMVKGSTFLTIYWPNGRTSQYHVKRIGPILHFGGQNGAANFTLREISVDNCWTPRI